MKKGSHPYLGGRIPYIAVGLCWLMLMMSFFSSPSDYQEHEGIVQKTITRVEDGELKTWNFQCVDSLLLNFTAPKRTSLFSAQMDVPGKDCPRFNPALSPIISSQSRSAQRRVPPVLGTSDLTCKPCANQHHHGVVASTRRQFFFVSPLVYETTNTLKDVHVAINLDTILLSHNKAHYDPARERYFAFANSTITVLNIPQQATLTVLPGKWEVNCGNGTLVITTDWASEVRAFLRTLFIFTKEEIVVDECDGREGACSRVCPPLRYPYLPCGSPIGKGAHSAPFQRSASGQRVIKHQPAGPASVAFGLAGLIRSVQFAGTSLHELILDRHEENAHVYVSTWNIIGQMQNGVYGFGDKLVSPRRISTILKEVFDPYLKDSDVLDFEQYKPLLDALQARQNYYHGRVHIHVSNVVRMIRESGRLYDIVVLSRPDIMWKTLVQFVRSGGTNYVLHVKISYDARTNVIKHHTLQLHPGTVVVHHEDAEFAGNTYSVGDSVFVGTAETMLRWEELFSYAQDNFIQHGGGAALSAFMSENGQYWLPADFDVTLPRIKCTRMSMQKAQEKQLAMGLYDEASQCYWSTNSMRL
jgi:hypothetical protein